jgi:hypothetical protein
MKGTVIIFLACTFAAGCAAKPIDKQQALQNLKAQAEEAGAAMVNLDHQREADLTHPELVKAMGGRDEFIRRLASMASEASQKGFQVTRVTVSEPSVLVEAKKDCYSIVVTSLKLSGPGGAVGTKRSFLIGVSTDRGATWKFIDGEGIGVDRGKAKQILPNFPDELPLPMRMPAEWEGQ